MKTNELQQLTSILGTDSLLADTAAAGTGRLTMAQAAEFFGAELIKSENPVGASLFQKAPKGLSDLIIPCDTNDDIDSALETVLMAMQNCTVKYFALNIRQDDLSLSGGMWLIELFRASSAYGCLTARLHSQGTPTKVSTRSKYNGAWGNWSVLAHAEFTTADGVREYQNPPMLAGVEYRTTERWGGAVIYAKLVDVGILPVNSTKTVAHGIDNLSAAASVNGCIGGVHPITYSGISSIDIDSLNITVNTTANMPTNPVALSLLLKYRKAN